MRFKLERSKDTAGWWVLTDTQNLVVIRFEENKFNETQKVSLLDDAMEAKPDATRLAKIMSEMGDWMAKHHGSICFNAPHGFEWSEDGETLYFYRNKPPRWRMEIQDATDAHGLAVSMKKAAAWLRALNLPAGNGHGGEQE